MCSIVVTKALRRLPHQTHKVSNHRRGITSTRYEIQRSDWLYRTPETAIQHAIHVHVPQGGGNERNSKPDSDEAKRGGDARCLLLDTRTKARRAARFDRQLGKTSTEGAIKNEWLAREVFQ